MRSFRVLREQQGRQVAAPRWVSPAQSRAQSQTVPGVQAPLLSGISYIAPLQLLEGKIRRPHDLHPINKNQLHPGSQTNPCVSQHMNRSLDQPYPSPEHQFNTCPLAFQVST